jgi:poly(U)-specific endoribonuclease
LADADIAVFKEYLRLIWMGQYNRGGGIEGSSGLEHVFLGEKNGNSISGYHGWIKYYRDELAGKMNYLGYMTKIDLGVVSLSIMKTVYKSYLKTIKLLISIRLVIYLPRAPSLKCP